MFRFPESLALVFMLVGVVSAADIPATDKPRAAELEKLQVELKQLQQSFGKDHPKIVAVQKRIGLLKRLETEFQLPEYQAFINNLAPMLLEEQDLISTFGQAHPKVKAIRRRIEFTTKYFTDKLKKSSEASAKKAGKPGSAHEAFLTMLPLLLEEQELIAKYGSQHPRVANVRKQIALARRKVVATSPTPRVSGRIGRVPEPDNSPGVDDDADKPGRYSMETHNGNVFLVDRETGRTWVRKGEAARPDWIPIPESRGIAPSRDPE